MVVLAAYRDLTEQAPRELTAAAIVRLAPPAPFLPQAWHGKPIAGIQLCHSGADPDADLAPVVDLVGPKPYVAMQSSEFLDVPSRQREHDPRREGSRGCSL